MYFRCACGCAINKKFNKKLIALNIKEYLGDPRVETECVVHGKWDNFNLPKVFDDDRKEANRRRKDVVIEKGKELNEICFNKN